MTKRELKNDTLIEINNYHRLHGINSSVFWATNKDSIEMTIQSIVTNLVASGIISSDKEEIVETGRKIYELKSNSELVISNGFNVTSITKTTTDIFFTKVRFSASYQEVGLVINYTENGITESKSYTTTGLKNIVNDIDNVIYNMDIYGTKGTIEITTTLFNAEHGHDLDYPILFIDSGVVTKNDEVYEYSKNFVFNSIVEFFASKGFYYEVPSGIR